MINFFIVILTLSQTLSQSTSPGGVGGDRDAYGCFTNAGYRWCFAESRCVRPWENNGAACNNEFTGDCATVSCAKGSQCAPSTGTCLPVSCDAQDACPSGSTCVPSEKPCKITPCPQFDCVENRCAAVQCLEGEDCDPLTGKCAAACPAGQLYNSCGSACPPTCQNRNPEMCTANCVAGCFCEEGKLLDLVSGECREPTQCPSQTTCPDGQEYNSCGTACPVTCQNLSEQLLCSADCVPGCFCKNGTILNEVDHQCVLQRQCPPQNGTESETGNDSDDRSDTDDSDRDHSHRNKDHGYGGRGRWRGHGHNQGRRHQRGGRGHD